MKAYKVNQEFITEKELVNVLALKQSLKTLKKQMESIQTSLADSEAKIVSKIDNGADCPSGYEVNISTVSRRYPSWKEHFLAHNGKQIADDILKNTPPKIYKNLNIKAA